MKEGYFVTRTYRAGRVCEKIKYWVPGKRPSKSGRAVRAEINKQEQNETQTIRAAARVLNENFRSGDIVLGLDYSDESLAFLKEKADKVTIPQSGSLRTPTPTDMGEGFENCDVYETASHELKLFLRRVKRECDKQGIEFKYAVAVTSDMDGKTGEFVRVHHHLVVNREVIEIVKQKWSAGGVHYEPLSAQPDYTAVAEYFIRQTRKIKDAKKFVCSRNLVRPMPKDRIVPSNAELRVPAKAVLLHRSEFKPGRPQYIRYLIPAGGEEQTDVSLCVPPLKNKRKSELNKK